MVEETNNIFGDINLYMKYLNDDNSNSILFH